MGLVCCYVGFIHFKVDGTYTPLNEYTLYILIVKNTNSIDPFWSSSVAPSFSPGLSVKAFLDPND